jgi:hypothetical protein
MTIGLKGNTDGSGAVQIGGSDAITISTGLNTTFAGTVTATGTVAGSTGTLYPLTSGTAVASTSGTALDFTGIPSWVKRITVMFSGVSTNGASQMQVQIGSGSFTTSGYSSYAISVGNAVATSGNVLTSGFHTFVQSASSVRHGHMIITNITGNTWVASHVIGDAGASFSLSGGGNVALSDTLTQVRITTVNGTDTFDAGSINILFE